MREKMLKLPPEFYTGQPVERFKRLAKALMAVPKKELDKELDKYERKKERQKRHTRKGTP